MAVPSKIQVSAQSKGKDLIQNFLHFQNFSIFCRQVGRAVHFVRPANYFMPYSISSTNPSLSFQWVKQWGPSEPSIKYVKQRRQIQHVFLQNQDATNDWRIRIGSGSFPIQHQKQWVYEEAEWSTAIVITAWLLQQPQARYSVPQQLQCGKRLRWASQRR